MPLSVLDSGSPEPLGVTLVGTGVTIDGTGLDATLAHGMGMMVPAADSIAGVSRFSAAFDGGTIQAALFQSNDSIPSAANRHCYLPPALPLPPGLST